MMDPSVFFRNRPVFWSWILIPLLLRVLVMTALSASARAPEEILRKEKALAAAAPVLLSTIEANRKVLKIFASEKLTAKERFLTDSADLLYSSGIQGSTDVSEKDGPAGSNLKKYLFTITGTVPSLPEFSQFLDDIGRIDYLKIRDGELSEKSIDNKKAYSFSLNLERVEFTFGTAL